MDGRNDMLRELCDESDGYVTTDQLRQLIDDPCMLKTALSTLDANNTGRIPFEKALGLFLHFQSLLIFQTTLSMIFWLLSRAK